MSKIGPIRVVAQAGAPPPRRPVPGTPVWMAIDISRSKAVYCLRWDGGEQRRLSTPLGSEHVRAVVEQYRGCPLHVAYEACGFGYELAWWLQAHGIAVSVIAPSRGVEGVQRLAGDAAAAGAGEAETAQTTPPRRLASVAAPPPPRCVRCTHHSRTPAASTNSEGERWL